jgi:exopolysaccharide production protein ExoY
MTLQMKDLSEDISLASAPLGYVSVPHKSGFYRNTLKRAFDLSFVILTSLIVLPMTLVLALIVASDGYRPLYRSPRVGRNGRVFQMLKLRTMVPDADGMLEKFLSENETAQLEWDSTQKLKRDPRITAVGRFLRKTSLDELPQLFNVLKGDMSLVGPRPMMPSQRTLYPGLAYYALRPGVTGPWQVSDRNESEFAKRAEFDREYERSVTLLSDMRLILATLRVVFKGTGY